MTDPNRYIREMYVTALYGVIKVYDGKAPVNAVTPYGVIRNISKTKETNKCVIYNCTVTLDIFNEFTEIGNTESLDLITDDVLTAIVYASPLPTVPNWQHVRCELDSDDQQIIEAEDLKQYQKTLRISHWVME